MILTFEPGYSFSNRCSARRSSFGRDPTGRGAGEQPREPHVDRAGNRLRVDGAGIDERRPPLLPPHAAAGDCHDAAAVTAMRFVSHRTFESHSLVTYLSSQSIDWRAMFHEPAPCALGPYRDTRRVPGQRESAQAVRRCHLGSSSKRRPARASSVAARTLACATIRCAFVAPLVRIHHHRLGHDRTAGGVQVARIRAVSSSRPCQHPGQLGRPRRRSGSAPAARRPTPPPTGPCPARRRAPRTVEHRGRGVHSRAEAIRYSLVIGFRFCGIVEEPTWPAVAGSAASATSVACSRTTSARSARPPTAICDSACAIRGSGRGRHATPPPARAGPDAGRELRPHGGRVWSPSAARLPAAPPSCAHAPRRQPRRGASTHRPQLVGPGAAF